MHRRRRQFLAVAAVAAVVAMAVPAQADHATRPHTENLIPRGHSFDPGDFTLPAAQRDANSDLAFWGDLAFVGDYDGFRIVDISNPDNPVEVARARCNGDQGDLVVWEDIVVRSWNSPAPAGRTCDGQPVPTGFEGVHVFDISDINNPTMIAEVELPCGSHTATLAAVRRNDIIVYSNNSSSSGCVNGSRAADDPVGDFMDIIKVPLDDPASAFLLRRQRLAGPTTDVRTGCHDAGVIRGQENKAACASADTVNVWDIGANETPGGTPTKPELLFTIFHPRVGTAGTNGRWHSAAFTWDGEVLALGWEPGGGGEAECEASDPRVDKSMFFYDADNGNFLGMWTLPRPQGPDENCTVHNYNIVPLETGRYVAVGGHYQAGTWVVDFTNPAKPRTVAWSDPPSLGPGPFCGATNPPGCQLGGAWSSYWYNDGFIYESDITKGLYVHQLVDRVIEGVINLPHLNPQTQLFSL